MDKNRSAVQGVVSILDHLYEYVPQNDGRVHTLIMWSDGLSCERHVGAKNARANEPTSLDRFEGLEPLIKIILLLQVSFVEHAKAYHKSV